MVSSFEIDFVLPWVDGNDPDWRAEKARYRPSLGADDSIIRYREWDLLKYWFRGVEQFAPWVHKIHFITWGHLPPWLNCEHPKLNIVRHTDYIPAEYLPTFSSLPIEMNMHRIKGLSERFVFFNDDTFLLKPVPERMFFSDGGLPCDSAVLSPVIVTQKQDIGSIALNNMCVINSYFSKKTVMRAHPFQWYSLKYGSQLLRTLCLLPWRHFPGFFNDHLPQAFLKSTFDTLWEAEPELLHTVSTHRFRDYGADVNQWLMRYWQFCEGAFEPISTKRGRDLCMADPATPELIRRQRYAMVCINDSADIADFAKTQAAYASAFAAILPQRCSFERA